MNYENVYEHLIENALGRDKPECYCERHHIIPRSLGGSDKNSNLVDLTAREHFIAHILLAKAFPESLPLQQAANIMLSRYKSSFNYGKVREQFSEKMKEYYENNPNPFEGRSHVESSLKMMSEKRKLQTKHWVFVSPDGVVYRHKSKFESFLDEHNLAQCMKYNRGLIIPKPLNSRAGINRHNSTGWFCIEMGDCTLGDEYYLNLRDRAPIAAMRVGGVKGNESGMKGRKHTEAARAKISKTVRERKINVGRKHTESTKEKMSGKNHRLSKNWVVTSPTGEVFRFTGGLDKFCEEHSLQQDIFKKSVGKGKIKKARAGCCTERVNSKDWEINEDV